MSNEPVAPAMPESWQIKRISDGKFVLCEYGKEGQSEYAYDNVDELLSALKDDLGDSSEEKAAEKPVSQLTSAEETDDEDK